MDYQIKSDINLASAVSLGAPTAPKPFRYQIFTYGNEKNWILQERRLTFGEYPVGFERFIGMATHQHAFGLERVNFSLTFPIPAARSEEEAWEFFGGCMQQRATEAVDKWQAEKRAKPANAGKEETTAGPPAGRTPGGLIIPR